MTYFRNCIEAAGFEKILAASMAPHGESAIEAEMGGDTPVQAKHIPYPSDAEQYRKIHGHLLKPARTEGIKLARTPEQEVKRLKQRTRFASRPRNRKKARHAEKRLWTIAGLPLKSNHQLNRNFLKGFDGDQINLLMAAAAFNFKKWIRKVNFWLQNIGQIFSRMINPAVQEGEYHKSLDDWRQSNFLAHVM